MTNTARRPVRRAVSRQRRIVSPGGRVDHEEINDLLPLYAAGALSAEERDVVRRHLHTCGTCCSNALLYVEAAAAFARSICIAEHRAQRRPRP